VQIALKGHVWRRQDRRRSQMDRNSRGATATRRLRGDWYWLSGVVVTAKGRAFRGTIAGTTMAGGGWWW
jgi:hypothetical protein